MATEQEQFFQVLTNLLSTDNTIRVQAEEVYSNLPIETKITQLLGAIQNVHLGDEARQMSAVLLRRLFSNEFMDFYPKLPAESQTQLKEQVLLAIQQDQSEHLRHKVCEMAAEVARNLIDDDGNNQWPEFLQAHTFSGLPVSTSTPIPTFSQTPQSTVHPGCSFYPTTPPPVASTSSSTIRSRRSLFRGIEGLSSVDITPRKKALMDKVRKQHEHLRKVKKLAKQTLYDLKNLGDLELSTALQDVFKDMSPAACTLMFSQMRSAKRAPNGRRWTMDDKVLSLAIYQQSPRCYNLLRRMVVLPSPRILQSLLVRIPFETGINRHIFVHLDQCLNSFDPLDRLCTLMFDEMSIRAHLQYDKERDEIEGLVDHGDGRRNEQLAKAALVFMVQGIRRKWKQPLAFYFTDGKMSATDLQSIISEVLDAAMQYAKLQIVAVICHMGTANRRALLNMGSMITRPFILHNGKKIFTIFDPPHLLKCTRNLFEKYNISFPVEIAGVSSRMTAKWSDVRGAYDVNNSGLVFRRLRKIHDTHFQTDDRSVMKVKYAAQLLSFSMASAIHGFVLMNHLPPAAADTASFILQVDDLFDSFNGNAYSAPDGKELLCFLTDKSPHLNFWAKAFSEVSGWKFISGAKLRTQDAKPPSQLGWLHSINAMRSLWSFVKSEKGLTYLRPRSFNQDPLENLFGMIRSGCGPNENPTVNQFVSSLKAQVVNNLTRRGLQGANCEGDDLSILTNLRSLIPDASKDCETAGPSCATETVNIGHDEVVNTANDIADSVRRGQANILSVAYVSGFVARRLLTSHNCDICKRDLTSESTEPHNQFICNKEFSTQGGHLVYPSERLVVAVGHGISLLEKQLSKSVVGKIQSQATSYIGEEVDFSWITCQTHFAYIKNCIIVGICRIGIPWFCTRRNRGLSSQTKSREMKRKLDKLQNQ